MLGHCQAHCCQYGSDAPFPRMERNKWLWVFMPYAFLSPEWLGRCMGELQWELQDAHAAIVLHRGCSLIVAGRVDADKSFRTMADVELPEPLRNLVSLPRLCAALH